MSKLELQQEETRRHFFENCGVGVGKLALASLLANECRTAPAADEFQSPFAPKPATFAGSAKRVIYLFMAGAPSQLELFDHKPKLAELEGKPLPPSVIKGQRYAFIQPTAGVLGPRFGFRKHGDSGAEISDQLPHLTKIVDDIAIVRSMNTHLFNHSPAQLFVNTGSGIPGRPAMGSWLSYGIGSEANDLPSFIVLKSGGSLSGGAAMWSSGFLPSVHQGVPFRGQGDPILHVSNPQGFDNQAQRDSLDLIRHLNQQRQKVVGDPEIATRINAYEMAYRMQSRAPELMDLQDETKSTLELYGANPGKGGSFANNCLLARRLAERGVRFIQVYHSGWDHHNNVEGGVRGQSRITDQASAALIQDLKQRGMLDDTLVVWGGEFGRTPMVEASAALGRTKGRDHHPQAYTMWLAGGGIKPGISIGKTDELGFHVVEDSVNVNELQATILHCMGIDHSQLTFKFRGLNFRLTGVEKQHPVEKLLS
ncbi:MAG: sulfatase [Planctomycetaceae bacterium]|nr:sulfatase [Planctomycetaceae bacterium]